MSGGRAGGPQRATTCPLPGRVVLLAVKPRFAEAILSGAKTVEMRRVRPKVELPAKALLYASSPSQAIVGCCEITGAVTSDSADLWAGHGPGTGLLRSEFDAYLAGAAAGTALTVARPERFVAPVSLGQMRAMGLRPPQSYSFVGEVPGGRVIVMGMRRGDHLAAQP